MEAVQEAKENKSKSLGVQTIQIPQADANITKPKCTLKKI